MSSAHGYPRWQTAPPTLAARRGPEGRATPAPRAIRSRPSPRPRRLPPAAAGGDGGSRSACGRCSTRSSSRRWRGRAGRTLVLASAGSGKTRTIVATLAHAIETGDAARGGHARHLHPPGGARRWSTAPRRSPASTCRPSPRAPSTPSAGASSPATARSWGCPGVVHGARRGGPGRGGRHGARRGARRARDPAVAAEARRRSSATPALAAESGRRLEAVVLEAQPAPRRPPRGPRAIADGYAERKRAMAAVDYADLLVLAVRLLEEHPRVRRRLAERLPLGAGQRAPRRQPGPGPPGRGARRRGGGNLIAVADPDQSVYSWRGRRPRGRDALRRRRRARASSRSRRTTARRPRWSPWRRRRSRPATPTASACGRSGRRRASAPVVAHLASVQDEAVVRRPSGSPTSSPPGARPARSPCSTAPTTTPSSCSSPSPQAGVEFELYSGARFVESAHVKDVLAFCRLRHNPRDELAWNRALRLFERVGAARGGADLGGDRRRARPARRRGGPARRRRRAPPASPASPRRSATSPG